MPQEKVVSIARYAIFFALFFILANASIGGLFSPFAFGLYFALIWCNQKFYILAPLYLAASLFVTFDDIALISTASTIIISSLIFAVHSKLQKPVTLPLFCVYAFLSGLGGVAAEFALAGSFVLPLASLVASLLFMLAAKEILTILLVRGLTYKLNLIETVSALVCLCALFAGLSKIYIFGFSLFKLLAAFLVLISSVVVGISTTLLIACVIGIGELVASGSALTLAPLVIWALVASCFRTQKRVFTALALVLTEAVMGYFLNLYGTYSVLNLLPVIVAALAFLLLPTTAPNQIREFCNLSSSTLAMRNVVNRSRESLCRRFLELSEAFGEMDYVFRAMAKNNYSKYPRSLDASRVLIAEQLSGVSQIMKDLAGEVKRNVSFDCGREEAIIAELSYNNIICSDVVVYEQNADAVSATLVVKKTDSAKQKIVDVVSDICRQKMAAVAVESSKIRGWDVITLKTAPKFDAVFGTASCPKSTSRISGDCYSIIRISEDKFLLALCDGMGSGEKAERTSSLAIGLVENFYKAGFNNEIILSSINKLLSLNRDEIFSALDVCVVDLRAGIADFIKLGAPQSYLKHKSEIEEISGGALPLGIVQDVTPMIVKKALKSGDFVYLFTDGISDSFPSEHALADFVNNQTSLNPQTLAEGLINHALTLAGGAKDDMTVIVAKVFATIN